MDVAHLLLLLLFCLTIGHLIALKVCSQKLDPRTAPLFISGWTLIGLAATAPVFGHLLPEGWAGLMAQPFLLGLAALKALLLYYICVISQKLMKVSLSSRHYVTPLSIGLIAIVNSFLGENLAPVEWFSALGLCLLAAAFFFKGHLGEMDRTSRIHYGLLVALAVILSAIDQVVLKETNWYALQVVCNVVLLSVSLLMTGRDTSVLRGAFMTRAAAIAGIFYMATELVKFYQMVSINPVSVVVMVQAMTKPVILLLSAYIWHERTVKEQLLWGILALIITIPLFL